MTDFFIPFIAAVVLAGLLTSWYLTKRKYGRKLTAVASDNALLTEQQTWLQTEITKTAAEKEVLSDLLIQSAHRQKELEQAIAEIRQEKETLSNDLEAALIVQAGLKAKYDALYIKHIELTNEKNRLKEQVQPK
jgi:septal ring factor EnvC (AmiA/AmiB activator)